MLQFRVLQSSVLFWERPFLFFCIQCIKESQVWKLIFTFYWHFWYFSQKIGCTYWNASVFVFCSFQVDHHIYNEGLQCTSKLRPLEKKLELLPSASLCAQKLYLRSAFLSLNWIQYKLNLYWMFSNSQQNKLQIIMLTYIVLYGGYGNYELLRVTWEWQSHSKRLFTRPGVPMIVTNLMMSSTHWNSNTNTFELEKIMPK